MNIYKVAVYYYDPLPENDSSVEEIQNLTKYFRNPLLAGVYADKLIKEHDIAEYQKPKSITEYPIIYREHNYRSIIHNIVIEEITLSD